ncbi:MAG: flavin reductase [Chloroflexi bacterium]|nr:flavin reductase [Chloroflexota bacterium]
MTTAPLIDARRYRDVIGRFATGVTVVTWDTGSVRRGMTANAVASVSLDPTLVLVCVDRHGAAHAQLATVETFALNVLAEDQLEVSRAFAQPGVDGMLGVPYRSGAHGAPLLRDAVAWLECAVHERLEGGDHTIYLGRVLALDIQRPEVAPLLFYAGAYRRLGAPLE